MPIEGIITAPQDIQFIEIVVTHSPTKKGNVELITG